MINSEWNNTATMPMNKQIIMKLLNDSVIIGCFSECEVFGDSYFINDDIDIEHVGFDVDKKDNGFYLLLKSVIIGWKEIPKDWLA